MELDGGEGAGRALRGPLDNLLFAAPAPSEESTSQRPQSTRELDGVALVRDGDAEVSGLARSLVPLLAPRPFGARALPFRLARPATFSAARNRDRGRLQAAPGTDPAARRDARGQTVRLGAETAPRDRPRGASWAWLWAKDCTAGVVSLRTFAAAAFRILDCGGKI